MPVIVKQETDFDITSPPPTHIARLRFTPKIFNENVKTARPLRLYRLQVAP